MKSIVVFFLLSLGLCLNASGQKLPNVQSASLKLPDNIKIDGKAAEWNNQFQSYNNAVSLFCTVANNSKNVYFLFKAVDKRVIQKLLYVGITVTITPSPNKNNSSKAIVVQYPKVTPGEGARIIFAAGAEADLESTKVVRSVSDTAKIYTQTQRDSLLKLANIAIAQNAKVIKVKGVERLTDTLLSIYNVDGFKVGATFDKEGSYTYELVVPIELLTLTANASFNYQVKLNSRFVEPQKGMRVRYYYPTRDSGPVDQDPDLDATTDFWGTHTLWKPE